MELSTGEEEMTISTFTLRLIGMACMVCDHLWATVIPGNDWLTWIGRLTFPIFAYLNAEGFFHTGDFNRYLRRMLFWAIVTELPFNLMYGGSWIYPFQQNVLWTFVLSLLCMRAVDRARQRYRPWVAWPVTALLVCFYYLAGTLLMVDYFGHGILMVMVFYFTRGRSWKERLLQLLCMVFINWELMRGLTVPVSVLGYVMEIPRQGMAALALLPIWACSGRQGHHSKGVQLACYAFYPVHMLILGLLAGAL